MCANGRGTYSWTVRINSGTYHQVGIAQSNWNHGATYASGSNNRFAMAYSHSSGWNRHRGAANIVSGHWGGTWDRTNKGSDMRMSLNCDQRRFTLSMNGMNAVFRYPNSWRTVYAAAAGQSSDNVYTITDQVCSQSSAPTTSNPTTTEPTSAPTTEPTSTPTTPAPTTLNPTSSPSYDVGAVIADVSRLQSSLDGEISTLTSRLSAVADGAVSNISLVRPTTGDTVDPDEQPPQITTADGYIMIEPSPGKGLTLGTVTDVEHTLRVAMERIDRLEQLLAAVLTE